MNYDLGYPNNRQERCMSFKIDDTLAPLGSRITVHMPTQLFYKIP